MTNGGALSVVAAVSLVIGVPVVVLVSLALVGLRPRARASGRAGRRGADHRSHRERPVTYRRHGDCRGVPFEGASIVLYGLYLLVF